jgi:hypothetical protein
MRKVCHLLVQVLIRVADPISVCGGVGSTTGRNRYRYYHYWCREPLSTMLAVVVSAPASVSGTGTGTGMSSLQSRFRDHTKTRLELVRRRNETGTHSKKYEDIQ